jgi:hypothetical protein
VKSRGSGEGQSVNARRPSGGGWRGNNRWSNVAATGRRSRQRRQDCWAHRSIRRLRADRQTRSVIWGNLEVRDAVVIPDESGVGIG